MKNFKYITILFLFINTFSICAQTAPEPLDPFGDPGAGPIDNGVIILFIAGIAILTYFASKKKLLKSE